MTRTAHRTAAAHDDPQSGPSRLLPPTSFFRLSTKWILAEPGRLAGVRKSRYINREGLGFDREGVAVDDRGLNADQSLVRAAHYVVRSADGRVDPANAELGAHVLITRGLRARNGVELARLLDAAERKPDGTYRCHGGRLPRVGVHMIASFSRGLSPEAAGAILEDYAQALSDRLQVPIEGQVHNDDEGQPDHAHMILGTRVVEAGVIGKKARALDAVSEKADGNATEVGGRLVGNTMEWIRSEWAARMRAATGAEVDHRSFARQGLAIKPVTYVPRTEVEYQRRRDRPPGRTDGVANWQTGHASAPLGPGRTSARWIPRSSTSRQDLSLPRIRVGSRSARTSGLAVPRRSAVHLGSDARPIRRSTRNTRLRRASVPTVPSPTP